MFQCHELVEFHSDWEAKSTNPHTMNFLDQIITIKKKEKADQRYCWFDKEKQE
jgi:hypothetical protein